MGVVVAAAGSLLGGLAGQAIMGTPKTYGPDVSVPGITSATIKKGGKGKPDEKVPQIDISQSLQWFDDAAKAQTAAYQQGLAYYNDALKQAGTVIQQGYKDANETLKPLSYSANQALNEQMRMMGLDPISTTVNMGSHAKDLNLSPDIQQQVNDLEKIKDPGLRAEAKQKLTDSIGGQLSDNQSQQAVQSNALQALKAPNLIQADTQDNSSATSFSPGNKDLATLQAAGYNINYITSAPDGEDGYKGSPFYSVPNTVINAYNNNVQTQYNQQKQDILTKQADLTSQSQNLNDFSTAYDSVYSSNYDAGYTGDQVAAKIEATPGYQFQMDQGTKAIERQGAAKGMVGSGNTLTSLAQYGQGLAENYYGMYMDNLSKIVTEGSPATLQISTNQVNESKDYGNLLVAGGQAGMDTERLIGDAEANSLYQKGNLYASAAQFNAQMQFNGIQGGLGREAGAMNNALAAGPAMMANQLAQQKFNYGIFQNQQGGAAYTSGGTAGTYSAGGLTYPDYTGNGFGGATV